MDRFFAPLAVGFLVALSSAGRGQDVSPPLAGPDVTIDASPLPVSSGPTVLPEPHPGVTPDPSSVPALGNPPAPSPSLDQQGLTEAELKEFELAIVHFDEALRRDPTNPQLYYHRALANYRKGDNDRALGDLFDAILRDPRQPEFYLARARVFTQMDRFDRARDDYNLVLSAEPLNKEALAEREELKVRQAVYDVQQQSNVSTAPTMPTPDSLKEAIQLAQLQAQIEAAIAQQEMYKAQAETFRRQRVTPTQTAPPPTTPKPDPATAAAANLQIELLNAQIATLKAQQAKASSDQFYYQTHFGAQPIAPAPSTPKTNPGGSPGGTTP